MNSPGILIEEGDFLTGLAIDHTLRDLSDEQSERLMRIGSMLRRMASEAPSRDPADPRIAEQVSPWSPSQDKLELAKVLKLVEEAGELVAIAARTLMQGADGADPKTGKINHDALADELSDVAAAGRHVGEHYGMDPSVLSVRAERKYSLKTIWHDMIRRGEC